MDRVLHWLGYGLCHQLPERSFFGGGLQVPVCARDTGIYLGFAVAVLLLILAYGSRRPSELPGWRISVLLGLFVLAMVVDGVSSYAGWRSTSNDLRLATGLLTGFALGVLTLALVNSQAWRRFEMDRILGEGRYLAVFIGAIPATFVAIRYLAPHAGIAYPLVVGAAIVITFVGVNLVIVCLMPPFERKASRWLDLKWPLALAFVLAFAELAAASSLKVWLLRVAGIIG